MPWLFLFLLFAIGLVDLGFRGCLDIFGMLSIHILSFKLEKVSLYQHVQYSGRAKSERAEYTGETRSRFQW